MNKVIELDCANAPKCLEQLAAFCGYDEYIIRFKNGKPCFRMLVNHRSFAYFKAGLSAASPEDDFFGNRKCTETPLYSLFYDVNSGLAIIAGFRSGSSETSIRYENGEILCRGNTELYVGAGDDPDELLRLYSGKLPQMPDTFRDQSVIGWNSWDYYFQTVTEEDVEENIEAISASPVLKEKLEYIIIDDGWQRGYGDWAVSSRFHGDLSRISGKIQRAGFVPGIWVAPFLVDYYSPIGLRHPEWLARNANGEIEFRAGGNGGVSVLDPTHPECETFLHELFSGLRKLGFRYFKIDFVNRLLDMRFANGMTSQEAIEHGMKIIRNAIGQDALLTGCGMPLHSGYGIVDAMRIAGDISTFWSNILASAREMATAYWMNRRQWLNDPDFLIVRSPLTTDEERYNPFFLPKPYQPFDSRAGEAINSLNEIRVWCSLLILGGGPVILSDRISQLNQCGLDLLETVLSNCSNDPAVPLDFFETGMPEQWLQKRENDCILGVFNWQDHDKAIRIHPDFSTASGVELWSNEKLSPISSDISMPPRSAKLFIIPKTEFNKI